VKHSHVQQPKDMVSLSHNTSRSSRTVVRDKSKVADDKDKTIDSLREKCQELLRLLGSQQKTFVQVNNIFFVIIVGWVSAEDFCTG